MSDNESSVSLAIPTKDRPQQLMRALSSFCENAKTHGRELNVLVSDQSGDRRETNINAAFVEHLPYQYDCTVEYLGRSRLGEFATTLSDVSGVRREIVDAALFGGQAAMPAYGANRNAILLVSAGSRVVCVDDDTVCSIASTDTSVDSTLELGGHLPLWKFRPAPDCAATQCAMDSDQSIDFIGAHASVLGRNLSDFATAGTRVVKDHSCLHLQQDILAGAGLIRLTTNGISGHSGMLSHAWLPFLNDEGLRKIVSESLEGMMSLLNSPYSTRSVEALCVSHSHSVMSTVIGLDSCQLLPPFLQCGRGEDKVYSFVLSTILEHAYMAELPFTIDHLPFGRKDALSSEFTRLSCSTVIHACIEEYLEQSVFKPGEAGLVRLGQFLSELAYLPEPTFVANLSQIVLRSVDRRMYGILSSMGEFSGAPRHLLRHFSRQLIHLEKIKASNDELEILACRDIMGNPIPTLRAVLQDFGNILLAWPALFRAAALINGKAN